MPSKESLVKPSLKWGSGKSSLLEHASDKPEHVIASAPKKEEEKEDTGNTDDVVFQVGQLSHLNRQMRVKVFVLEDKEYKSRGKGVLRIVKYVISLLLLVLRFPNRTRRRFRNIRL